MLMDTLPGRMNERMDVAARRMLLDAHVLLPGPGCDDDSTRPPAHETLPPGHVPQDATGMKLRLAECQVWHEELGVHQRITK